MDEGQAETFMPSGLDSVPGKPTPSKETTVEVDGKVKNYLRVQALQLEAGINGQHPRNAVKLDLRPEVLRDKLTQIKAIEESWNQGYPEPLITHLEGIIREKNGSILEQQKQIIPFSGTEGKESMPGDNIYKKLNGKIEKAQAAEKAQSPSANPQGRLSEEAGAWIANRNEEIQSEMEKLPVERNTILNQVKYFAAQIEGYDKNIAELQQGKKSGDYDGYLRGKINLVQNRLNQARRFIGERQVVATQSATLELQKLFEAQNDYRAGNYKGLVELLEQDKKESLAQQEKVRRLLKPFGQMSGDDIYLAYRKRWETGDKLLQNPPPKGSEITVWIEGEIDTLKDQQQTTERGKVLSKLEVLRNEVMELSGILSSVRSNYPQPKS